MSLPIVSSIVTEVKQRLEGPPDEFACTCVAASTNKVVLLYRHPEGMHYRHLQLPSGSFSLGYYWTDRPYNVYHWVLPDGHTAGCYFNVADQTRFDCKRILWRDLILDVLALPNEPPRVLDRDELPADMDSALRRYIERAVQALCAELPVILAELEAESAVYYRQFPLGSLDANPLT